MPSIVPEAPPTFQYSVADLPMSTTAPIETGFWQIVGTDELRTP